MTTEREKALNIEINEKIKKLSRLRRLIKLPDRKEKLFMVNLEMEIDALIDALADEKAEDAG